MTSELDIIWAIETNSIFGTSYEKCQVNLQNWLDSKNQNWQNSRVFGSAEDENGVVIGDNKKSCIWRKITLG